MEVLFDRVAGLDVGKATLTVFLPTPGPPGRRRAETRRFRTTTGSLRVMRDWLVEAGVRIAAMESTSTYWKPPICCPEEVMDLVEQAMAELDAVIVDACRPWQHQIDLLQTIPGVAEKVAQVIIAETGADMTRFPTAAHLARAGSVWCRRWRSPPASRPRPEGGTAASG